MNKGVKIAGLVIGGLVLLSLLIPKSKDQEPATSTVTTNSSEPVTSTNTPKKWVTVLNFKGNGSKKSANFHLSGHDARLRYNYKSNVSGMGVFNVFVPDAGVDINKEGGLPEVTSSANEEKDQESTLQKSAGNYYLNVMGAGSWTVVVEEMQ